MYDKRAFWLQMTQYWCSNKIQNSQIKHEVVEHLKPKIPKCLCIYIKGYLFFGLQILGISKKSKFCYQLPYQSYDHINGNSCQYRGTQLSWYVIGLLTKPYNIKVNIGSKIYYNLVVFMFQIITIVWLGLIVNFRLVDFNVSKMFAISAKFYWYIIKYQ